MRAQVGLSGDSMSTAATCRGGAASFHATCLHPSKQRRRGGTLLPAKQIYCRLALPLDLSYKLLSVATSGWRGLNAPEGLRALVLVPRSADKVVATKG